MCHAIRFNPYYIYDQHSGNSTTWRNMLTGKADEVAHNNRSSTNHQLPIKCSSKFTVCIYKAVYYYSYIHVVTESRLPSRLQYSVCSLVLH